MFFSLGSSVIRMTNQGLPGHLFLGPTVEQDNYGGVEIVIVATGPSGLTVISPISKAQYK